MSLLTPIPQSTRRFSKRYGGLSTPADEIVPVVVVVVVVFVVLCLESAVLEAWLPHMAAALGGGGKRERKRGTERDRERERDPDLS